MNEFYRDFTFSLGTIEDSPGLDDVNKPIVRNLVFSETMTIHPSQIKDYRLYFTETHIETESGWFQRSTTLAKGLISDTRVYSQRSKTVLDFVNQYMADENGVVSRNTVKMEHLHLKLFMTNKIQKYKKQYSTFVDFLGSIGKFYKILGLILGFVLIVHYQIELDLYYINDFFM